MTLPAGSADLHIHTSFSDGRMTPAEAVMFAEKKGLAAISIADHDTVNGVTAALATPHTLDIIPAVELSALYDGIDIHILGYYIDHTNPALLRQLAEIQKVRVERAHEIVRRLNSQGMELNVERIFQICQGDSVGRPHIAQALMEEGYVATFDEAFYKFIGYHCPAYVPKAALEPKAAIELIRRFGGIPVLAHPGAYRKQGPVDHMLRLGVDGLEVWHPEHSNGSVGRFLAICQRMNLLATGGSDYHGCRGTVAIGSALTPPQWLAALRARH